MFFLQIWSFASHLQPKSDAFCWSCHRDEPQLFCSMCVRSFHISPACSRSKKMSAEEMEHWVCPDCNEVNKDIAQVQARWVNREALFQFFVQNKKEPMFVDEYNWNISTCYQELLCWKTEKCLNHVSFPICSGMKLSYLNDLLKCVVELLQCDEYVSKLALPICQ